MSTNDAKPLSERELEEERKHWERIQTGTVSRGRFLATIDALTAELAAERERGEQLAAEGALLIKQLSWYVDQGMGVEWSSQATPLIAAHVAEHNAAVAVAEIVDRLSITFLPRGEAPSIAIHAHKNGGATIWHGASSAYKDAEVTAEAIEELDKALTEYEAAKAAVQPEQEAKPKPKVLWSNTDPGPCPEY